MDRLVSHSMREAAGSRQPAGPRPRPHLVHRARLHTRTVRYVLHDALPRHSRMVSTLCGWRHIQKPSAQLKLWLSADESSVTFCERFMRRGFSRTLRQAVNFLALILPVFRVLDFLCQVDPEMLVDGK